MSHPGEMEDKERKRQYAAMNRAVASSMNPALIAKMRMCSDAERLLTQSREIKHILSCQPYISVASVTVTVLSCEHHSGSIC